MLPRVARPSAGLSTAAIAIGAVLAGAVLFSALEARRAALTAPAVRPARADLIAASDAPPPLYIPPVQPPAQLLPHLPATGEPVRLQPSPRPVQPPSHPAAPSPPGWQPYAPPPPATLRAGDGAILIFDAPWALPGAGVSGRSDEGGRAVSVAGSTERARAGSIADRSTTVPQGTLIPAVLETGFDSSGAGFARALVQHDVHGFDGVRVLIPRGSRLIGEYTSETAPGQKRAFVTWTRLIRPDGVTIAIGSPSTDPAGVAGVRTRVNSHFVVRFSEAFLQTVLMIGGNLAARSVGDPVVVALPGALPGANMAAPPTRIPPTLRIRVGTSIGVFVARDLDFADFDPWQ